MSKSIGRYVHLQGGFAFKSSDFKDSGIPLIRISNITNNGLDKTEAMLLPYEYQNELKDFLAQENDTLIAMSGATTGKCCLIKERDLPCLINQRVGRFKILNEKEVDKVFVFYVVNSQEFQNELLKDAIGGAQPNVSPKQIERINWDFPKYQAQRRIALILTTCDAVIEKTQAAIAKYKAIKQGMLHDLFTRGIDITTGKLRPKYADAPELYKESKLGFIPKEWNVEMIGDVSSLVTNGFVGVATPYYTTADQGVPYLFGTNIREDSIEFNDLRYISREFNSSHVKSQLKPGDMLCVQSGHIGTCAVVPDNFVEANCHALIITRFYKEMIYPEFISFYLNSSIGKHQLDKIIIGSTIKHINTSDLAKHLIPKPPVDEQKGISKRLRIIDQKHHTEQNYLHKLQQLKAGLMGNLLSGSKKVSVPEEVLTQTEN